VLERDGVALLLIDCGPGTLDRFVAAYGALPTAAFITHVHLDHIADLEAWFYRLAFDAGAGLPRLYVPASLVPWLQRRIADFPNWVAEGGRNFWDVFQLIPVAEHFWAAGYRFSVFAVRHHAPDSAFGLSLSQSFLYSGDTRPIPDQLRHHGGDGAHLFHDCAPQANPSHSGLSDLMREYSEEQRSRMVLYHYPDAVAARAYADAGFAVAAPGSVHALPAPAAEALQSTWAQRSMQ
jgi:ribonuclease BN (tRNA processing enzyme)